MKIDSMDLSKTVQKLMKEYGDDVTEITRRLVKKAGNEARDKLKQKSPKLTGDYAKAWTAGNYVWSALGAEISVYIKTRDYSLTHLLEKGHAKRGGGRVQAFPHIKPVEKETHEELEKNLIQAVKNL